MKDKINIDFTNTEIETIYYSLMNEINRTIRNAVSYNLTFETLESWYLLLKKIRKAQKYYEQKK